MSSSILLVALFNLEAGIASEAEPARLYSYWDEGACGLKGDDHNWRWCGWLSGGRCPSQLSVESSLCPTRKALLLEQKTDYIDANGCRYYGYAEFVCETRATKEASEQLVLVGELSKQEGQPNDNVTQAKTFRRIGVGKECSNILKTLSNSVSSTQECAELVLTDSQCGSKFEDRSHNKKPGRCSCMAPGATCKLRKDRKTNRYELIAPAVMALGGLPRQNSGALTVVSESKFRERSLMKKESGISAQKDSKQCKGSTSESKADGGERTKLIQGLMAEKLKTKQLQKQLQVQQATVDDLSKRLRMDMDRTNFLRLRLERVEKDVQIKREVQVALQELMAIKGDNIFGVQEQKLEPAASGIEYIVKPQRSRSWWVLLIGGMVVIIAVMIRHDSVTQAPLALDNIMLEGAYATEPLCNNSEKVAAALMPMSGFSGHALRYGFPSPVPYQLVAERPSIRVHSGNLENVLNALKRAASALIEEASQEVLTTAWASRFRFIHTHFKLQDHPSLVNHGVRALRDDTAFRQHGIPTVPVRRKFLNDIVPEMQEQVDMTRSVHVLPLINLEEKAEAPVGVDEFLLGAQDVDDDDIPCLLAASTMVESQPLVEELPDMLCDLDEEWECVGEIHEQSLGAFGDDFELVGGGVKVGVL